MSSLSERVGQSLAVQEEYLTRQLPALATAAKSLATALLRGNQLITLGCPVVAEHMAAEITGRLDRERDGLPAVSLSENTAAVTAIANDYGREQVYARQLAAVARTGDFVVALLLPGDAAARAAADLAYKLGLDALVLDPPSSDVASSVETFVTAGHLLCEETEAELRRVRPALFRTS